MHEDNMLLILKKLDIVTKLSSIKWDKTIGDEFVLHSEPSENQPNCRIRCKTVDGHPAIEYEYGNVSYIKTLFGFKVIPKSYHPLGGVSSLVSDLIKYVIDTLKITTGNKIVPDLNSLNFHYDIGVKKEVRYKKYLVMNLTVEQFRLDIQKLKCELNCMLFEEAKCFYLYVKEKNQHKRFIHYEDNPQNRKLLWPEISEKSVRYDSRSDAWCGSEFTYERIGLKNLRTYTEIVGLGFAIIEEIIQHDYNYKGNPIEMMQQGKLYPIVYNSFYGKTIKFIVNGFETKTKLTQQLKEW